MNMKVLNVFIRENLYTHIAEQARNEHTDIQSICNKILEEYYKKFLTESNNKIKDVPPVVYSSMSYENIKTYNVDRNFRGFPQNSIQMAQIVIDYIKTISINEPILCRRTDAAIDFEPNFIRIERLISQGLKYGINISIYGEPYRYRNPPSLLQKGMNGYSRAYIRNHQELELILNLLKETWYLKNQQMIF